MNLVSKEFLQTSIPPLILYFMQTGITIFQGKLFCLAVPEKIVGEPFSVPLVSGVEKTYASEGYVTIFRGKFLVSQYRNNSQRNHSALCFRKMPVAKKFMDKGGGERSIKIFLRNFFVSRCRKIPQGNPLVFH